jgi:hypothetical protein
LEGSANSSHLEFGKKLWPQGYTVAALWGHNIRRDPPCIVFGEQLGA